MSTRTLLRTDRAALAVVIDVFARERDEKMLVTFGVNMSFDFIVCPL